MNLALRTATWPRLLLEATMGAPISLYILPRSGFSLAIGWKRLRSFHVTERATEGRRCVSSVPLGPPSARARSAQTCACVGRRQRGLVAGSGHEQKEPGLLRAAGRARLSQPLQAAGRVSGGAHGGNQGNGLALRSGGTALPARGLVSGPRFLAHGRGRPLPGGGKGQRPLLGASRAAMPLRPSGLKRRRWGSGT